MDINLNLQFANTIGQNINSALKCLNSAAENSSEAICQCDDLIEINSALLSFLVDYRMLMQDYLQTLSYMYKVQTKEKRQKVKTFIDALNDNITFFD